MDENGEVEDGVSGEEISNPVIQVRAQMPDYREVVRQSERRSSSFQPAKRWQRPEEGKPSVEDQLAGNMATMTS